jgi:uncharacterized protein
MFRFIHFEMSADDPEKLVNFYGKVFGWTAQKWEGPVDYWLIKTGPDDQPGIDGGIGRRGRGDTCITNTLDVPSVDEYLAKIESNGGAIARLKMPIPGIGYLAYCKDPEGNVFGIMETDPSAE